MRTIGDQNRISLVLIAVVLLLQLSPALATGQPDARQAASPGSRPIEVTFTKWVPAFPTLAGVTGGDVRTGQPTHQQVR